MRYYKYSLISILIILTLVILLPFLVLVYQSFFDLNYFEGKNHFVGLSNYAKLLKDSDFLSSVNIISPIVIAILFLLLVDPQFGFVSDILSFLKFNNPNQILGNSNRIFNALIITDIWQWSGIIAFLFWAKIKSIPVEYSELIFTNNGRKSNYNALVTLPYLFNFTLALIVFKFFWNLGFVEIIDTITAGGGPHGAMRMFPIWIDRIYFRSSDYGYGASAAILFYLIAILGLIIFFLLLRKQTELK